MNEKLNLVEILKDCPKGTKLYSTNFGVVKFDEIGNNPNYPIVVSHIGGFEKFTKDGRLYCICDGECVLFPSKDQRDWSKFNIKKPKFDPKTLKPFDRVLARFSDDAIWKCALFSHEKKEECTYKYVTTNYDHRYCIPYNDDTKHLVGTTEEAPEFYRYWED